MNDLRPRLRGLVSKLALFYLLLSLPILLVVESSVLTFEFHRFMSAVEHGSIDRAATNGAAELSRHWASLRRDDADDPIALQTWLDGWILRLRQPDGGLTPDGSYVLLELSGEPLAAAILTPDGRALARTHDTQTWTPPTREELALASRTADAMPLAADQGRYRIHRAMAPLHNANGKTVALLFVELRVPPLWERLLSDASYESPTVFGFLVVFGLASSIFLAAWVTRRLNRFARAAAAWSRGDFSNRIDDRSRDEIGSLSMLLDRMALDLKGLLRTRAQLATLAERQRLARDLHDTVKQKAFALNLQLATARRVLAEAPGAERLEAAQRLTQQIQQELGQILDEMRASDAELPLAERVRTRANEWAHTSGMALAFDLDDVPPFAAAIEESLLRIVDEALSNVLRHSGATRVDLTLRREAERVRLAIGDNGRGTPGDPSPGMGLRNMRERAQALPDGRFAIEAPTGGGTRVSVSFLVAEIPAS